MLLSAATLGFSRPVNPDSPPLGGVRYDPVTHVAVGAESTRARELAGVLRGDERAGASAPRDRDDATTAAWRARGVVLVSPDWAVQAREIWLFFVALACCLSSRVRRF